MPRIGARRRGRWRDLPLLTTDFAQQHPIEGPGDQRPTTEFTDTHRKEKSDQPCLFVSFRSTNVRPLCAAHRLSRQVITTERPHPTGGSCPREGHRNGNTFGSPFRVVPCFPWLRIFLRLGRAVLLTFDLFAQRPIVKTGNNHGTTPPYGRELPPGRTQKWKHIRISFPCCSVFSVVKNLSAARPRCVFRGYPLVRISLPWQLPHETAGGAGRAVLLPGIEVNGDGGHFVQRSQGQRSQGPSCGGIRPDSRQNSHRDPGGSMSSPRRRQKGCTRFILSWKRSQAQTCLNLRPDNAELACSEDVCRDDPG